MAELSVKTDVHGYSINPNTVRMQIFADAGYVSRKDAERKLLEWADSDKHDYGKMKFIGFLYSGEYSKPGICGVWEKEPKENHGD